MTPFEFAFALYALMLGFSMVALLSGLGNAMEYKFAREAANKDFTIGWLTPLFAIFVMLDLISFWISAWTLRQTIEVNASTILGVTVFASSYYLAARLVFPSDVEAFTDLDDHFYRVRRVVLGILVMLVFAQWGYLIAVVGWSAIMANTLSVSLTLVLLALMGLTMIWKNDSLNIALLVLLCARYLSIYIFF